MTIAVKSDEIAPAQNPKPRSDHCTHSVQFYEDDAFLVETVSRFIGAALGSDEPALIIATREHREAIDRTLQERGFDVSRARARNKYRSLDAAQVLSQFMVDGAPDPARFMQTIGDLLAELATSGSQVHAFGEMVALLCQSGDHDAALRLEDLWNDLATTHSFSLLCAYPMAGFAGAMRRELFEHICTRHAQVLPTEGYSLLPEGDARHKAIAALQQKSRSLEFEIAARSEAEQAGLLLAAIVDSSDDAIISKSLDGIITSWNAGAKNIFGYSAEEAIGRHVTLLIPADRLHEEDIILGKLRAGQRIDHYETVRVAKDGRRVDISLTVSPIRDSQGRLIGASKIARDITQRVYAEKLLRERELYLKAIVETTPECIKVVAADGTLLDMNPAGLSMVAADSLARIKGASIFDLIAPEFREKFRVFNDRVCGGHAESLEFDIIGLDGRRHSMESFAVPLTTPEGCCAQLALTRDVTARKKVELELRQNEAQFRQMANALPQIVWTARPDGFLDYYNDRWYEFTGFRREDFGDDSWKPILHPDDLQRCADSFYACVHSGADYQIEYRFKDRATGDYRWFLGRASPVRDEQGRIVKWFGTCTDIEHAKKAEERLRKQNERLRLLNESAGHLLASDEPEEMVRGLFQRIHRHLEVDSFFNYLVDDSASGLTLLACAGAPEDLTRQFSRVPFGQGISGNVAASRRPLVVSDIQKSSDPTLRAAVDMGMQVCACYPLLAGHRLLGTLSFASRTRTRLDADDLEFISTLCHYVSIAYERVRLLRELRHADKQKDDFLATLAHELRNPLAPISSSLEILRLESGRTPANSRLQEVMDRQVRHLVRLVDDLLEVSRITSGKISLRREPIDLTVVLKSAIDASLPLIEKSRHQLSISLPEGPIALDADSVRLTQVFVNLLNNAAKYTEDHGRIHISAKCQPTAAGQRGGGTVIVSIRDTGMGIPANMLPRVFDMFAQVDRTLSRSQGGLGIGLALARNLIELHGGQIEARSQGLGHGSEFLVTLPTMSADTPVDHAAETTLGGPGSRRRILIVDDNRDAATSLELLLKMLKHDTRVAFSGAQAIETADEFMPDIVLMDIGMPGMDGFQTARHMRQSAWAQNAKLIALTGWGQDEDRKRSTESGFDHHFTKPLNIESLLELLADTRGIPPDRQCAR